MEPYATLLAAATLLYSSYHDLRTREVDDKVWIVPAAVGAVINIYPFLGADLGWLIRYGLAAGLTAAVAFGLYFTGLYGGADAKALVTISFIQPFTDRWPQLHGFTGLVTLTNGLILSTALPAGFAAYNLYRLAKGEKIFDGFEGEPVLRKAAACFIGVRLKKAVGRRFWSPVEKTVNGVRRFSFNLSIDDLREADRDDIWITPGIPLLVFFTAGYLTNLAAGDIMAWILYSLFGK